jgi:hypothetical protein
MPPKKYEKDVKVGKHLLRWTGYKSFPGSITLHGQWVALNGLGGFHYSSTDGHIGTASGIYHQIKTWHELSHCEYIPILKKKDAITIFTSAADKERFKQEALETLVEYLKSIEEAGNGKTENKSV